MTWCAIFFGASMILNVLLFLLNIIFGWHIPAIGLKPYIPGSPYDANVSIDIDNLQDFLLFEFMFGVAFIISATIAWSEIIWEKIKAHPLIATLIGLIIIGLSIPLGSFFMKDIGASQLYAAMENDDIIAVEEMLKKNPPGKEKSSEYFFAALQSDSYKVIPILATHGYDINAADAATGLTPLMTASSWGTPETVALLLENKASPQIQDQEGRNSLLRAILDRADFGNKESIMYSNLIKITKQLLEAVPGKEKELINQADQSGLTPLQAAKEKNMDEVISKEITRPRTIPILMFHYVREVDKTKDLLGYNLSITPDSFEKILQDLTQKGYHTIHVADILNQEVPDRSIVITFDDGYEDFYTTAWPLLKKYNFTASQAIITGKMDGNQYMTPEQVKEIDKAGIEILSHTVNHRDLEKYSHQNEEIKESKKYLENLLQKPVIGFVYPSGKYNNETLRLLQENGYKFALTTKPGDADLNNNLFELHRIQVDNRVELDSLPKPKPLL